MYGFILQTSKSDPENEPFRSKYKARELLQELKNKIEHSIEDHPSEGEKINFKKSAMFRQWSDFSSHCMTLPEFVKGSDSLQRLTIHLL